MTLAEIAAGYYAEALRLRVVIGQLRARRKTAYSAEQRAALGHEIAVIAGVQEQCYALAELCEKYYERGYYRNPRYTMNE